SVRGRAVVVRMVSQEPGTASYLASLALDRASNWSSFQRALARWKLPSENIIYADVDGNIGWIAAGLNPLRSWSGLLPVPGDGRYEWTGFLPFSELPQLTNPPSGIIATANHNILPNAYRHQLNYEWATSYRVDRIRQVLSSREGWTRDDFERLQHDEFSIPASELVPVLLEAAKRQGTSSPGLQAMTSWDFVMRKEAAQPL